jgi:glucuronyl/N-acetylglucosaminyl transferase EXT2
MKRLGKSTELTARARTAGDSEKEILPSPSSDSNDKNSPSQDKQQEEEINSKLFRRQLASHKKIPLVMALMKLKYHWTLMSTGSKIASAFVVLFLFQHVVIGAYDQFFHRVGTRERTDDINISLLNKDSSPEKSFAVAINTYKRPDMLRDAVQHYADTCGRRAGVSQVFVIWAEQGAQVPESSSFFTASTTLRNSKTILANRAEVHVLQKAKDSLNSRFEPIEQLQSTSVFMVDDDLRVACPSLSHGFHAWNHHPDSMVGYYPRLASTPRSDPQSQSELIYHTWPFVYMQHRFNFVLTKASFLHSKYLELYTSDQFPQSIRDHVDKNMNCEDIAMSLLVANYTKYKSGSAPANPIYLEGRVHDAGLFGGISTGSGHMTTRSECLTKLTAIFRENGWGSPLSYEVPLSDYSWIKHAPGFWWQYRPSNFFEWLAFGNTFT